MGTPVKHTFPDMPDVGFKNAQESVIEDLRNAGFVVDECETVAEVEELLSAPVTVGNHVAAVASGGVDSAHLAFVTRFRRVNSSMFLAIYDRDTALSVEMRTMLKSRHVDMVTCWSDHLVAGLKRVAEGDRQDSAMADKIFRYRTAIHDIFANHDEDKTGFIEGDEQYEFACDVAKLMCPAPGPERTECLNKIWDTMVEIDADGDQKISWEEFWRFVTRADDVAITQPKVEVQPLVKFSAFVLVVLQRADGSFCLVQSEKGWWLIGGALAMGQSPEQAAIHMSKDQAGVDVRLEGVLRVEFDHRAGSPGSRMRTIYLARPLNDFEPLKTIPDSSSLGAVWVDGASVTVDNPRIPLAGSEPAVWFDYVMKLGPIFPLEVFTSEGQAPHDQMLSAKAHSPFAEAHCAVEQGGLFNTTLGPVYPNSP